jgi:hypothetical protein
MLVMSCLPDLSIVFYRIYVCYTNIAYSIRYYPWFYVTAVGLGTYYPWIGGITVSWMMLLKYRKHVAKVHCIAFWNVNKNSPVWLALPATCWMRTGRYRFPSSIFQPCAMR